MPKLIWFLKNYSLNYKKIMAGKGGGMFNKKPIEQLKEEAQQKIDAA
jgi:hypothetical protein